MLLIDPYNCYICNSDMKVDQTHKEKKKWRYFAGLRLHQKGVTVRKPKRRLIYRGRFRGG